MQENIRNKENKTISDNSPGTGLFCLARRLYYYFNVLICSEFAGGVQETHKTSQTIVIGLGFPQRWKVSPCCTTHLRYRAYKQPKCLLSEEQLSW